jgi:hypothetical protein
VAGDGAAAELHGSFAARRMKPGLVMPAYAQPLPCEPMGVSDGYARLAEVHGLEPIDDFWPGPVTPLLAKGGELRPALRGDLVDGVAGVIARYAYGRFEYNVVFARIPESQPFVPRLQCERLGRLTDDTHYGFEVRNSRLWTESEVLNERYKVTVSPFQDDNWLRQLFAPQFIDWLAHESPADFSFELAYGALLSSIEQDEPSASELSALWDSSATVATRIHDESHE